MIIYGGLSNARRVIIMLDNAISAAQVRALLPGPGPSLVMVTTRRRLAGLVLDGARFIEVLPLDEQAAVELLSRIVGMAVAADLVVIPGRWHLGSGYEQARLDSSAFDGPADALDWLELELPGLLGAVRLAHDNGLHEQAWGLCEALWGLFVNRRPYQHWAEVHTLGLASARACGDRRAQARMLVHLGFADLCLGRHDQAMQQFVRALALDRAEGHLAGEATALDNLGLVGLAAGDPDGALGYFTQARALLDQPRLFTPRSRVL